MVDLKASPYYLSDEDIKWVNNTIDSMTDEEFSMRAYAWRKRATISRNIDILDKK